MLTGMLDKALTGLSAALLAALVAQWSYMHLWALPAEHRAGYAAGVAHERAAAAAELEARNDMIRKVSESATEAWDQRDVANREAALRADKALDESKTIPPQIIEITKEVATQVGLPAAVLRELNRIK